MFFSSSAKTLTFQSLLKSGDLREIIPTAKDFSPLDKFSLKSKKNDSALLVHRQFYELMKGLALQYINLFSKEPIKEADLTLEHWEACKTYFIKQAPEFIVTKEGVFGERVELAKDFRNNLKVKHEKILEECSLTLTCLRQEIDSLKEMKKNGIAISYARVKKEQLGNPRVAPNLNWIYRFNPQARVQDYPTTVRVKLPKVLYPDGVYYEGEWLESKKDGQGFKVTNDGEYEGSFKDGLRHGYGQLKTRNGSVYKGMFAEDCFEGEGIFQNREGYSY